MSNADVVLAALGSFAVDGRAVAPIPELAALTELHEAQVRRALAELCGDGRIQPDGKVGRTSAFRLSPPTAGARRRRDATPKEESSSSTIDRSMPRDPTPAVAPPDDEEGDPDELRRIGLTALYRILDGFGEDELGAPDQEPGECGECGQEARGGRWSLGLALLCHECRARRRRVGVRVAEERAEPVAVAVATPGQELADELTERALDGLVEQYGNGNGNGRSPLWDEPAF